MATATPRLWRRRPFTSAALVGLTALSAWLAIWWVLWSRPNLDAALHANSRGIGHLDQFDYDKAVEAFAEAAYHAPDWLPARINLGIALLSRMGSDETHLAPKWLPKGVHDAIRQRTLRKREDLARAATLFQQVLRREPDNPYALYGLGLIARLQQKPSEAAVYFRRVTQLDPNDGHAWYWLAESLGKEDPEWRSCLERAVRADPYLHPAAYSLGLTVKAENLAKARALMRAQELAETNWANDALHQYGQMGRYAEPIGRPPSGPVAPKFGPLPFFWPDNPSQVRLRSGARWATAADFGADATGELRRAVRERFGGCIVSLDYNRDGRMDLFLVGAVVEGGRVCDLLLRNDGGGRFSDVTLEAGLGGARAGLGCCVADFDNNGFPDLLITGIDGLWLFRNIAPTGRFEDVSALALGRFPGVALGAGFVDLDQDGDLDLLVARYAESSEAALRTLRGESGMPTGGLVTFLNVGQAPAPLDVQDPPPLAPSFRVATGPAALLGGRSSAVGLAAADLDGDRDLDLLVLSDAETPALVLNDRLLRFQREEFPLGPGAPSRWNGALILDAERRGISDLFLVAADEKPRLYRRGRAGTLHPRFERVPVQGPALLQAHAVDLDLDGWTDVIGLSAGHRPVVLHNQLGRLVHVPEALGRDADWRPDVVGLAVCDVWGAGRPDLVVWSESAGVQVYRNQDNGNRGVFLDLTGHRRRSVVYPCRCNADGIGAVAMLHAGPHFISVENTTLSAGLGQSRAPLVLGLGPGAEPDVVRVRWPDNLWQAEFNVPAGRVTAIDQTNRRRGSSCPLLFAWDGQHFDFVTDFLGAGSLGELQPDGSTRAPRPEESIKIEPGRLAPRDGQYVLKLAEATSEVTYLDRLQLAVVDHPADVRVYPDERFSSVPPASQDLLVLGRPVLPSHARDERGRDVTKTLAEWDRQAVDGFVRRGWVGLAADHWVELDFGTRLASFGPNDGLVLCLAGWTDYPYPESIWAATQAGVSVQPPVLERRDRDGRWRSIVADAGFPAGLPRMMTLDVTGLLDGDTCVLRLRTNLCVYWDQIFVAPLLERIPPGRHGSSRGGVRVEYRNVGRAVLATRGCVQEFSPDGRPPAVYAYDRLDPTPVSRPAGSLTTRGEVTDLLRENDDRLVVFGPGDEVTACFDAGDLPALPSGWVRSFVLRTWGYCKDCGPFTATGQTIEPMPYRGMPSYPYPARHRAAAGSP